MGVVVASELHHCAGVPLGSSNIEVESQNPQQQVTDEEAAGSAFIPADGISACLVSERRVLVTGGVLDDDRVLPLSVIRFFDLNPDPDGEHKWTKPLVLTSTKEAAKKGKRKKKDGTRSDGTRPVCRMDHTLTLVPDLSLLFLIGGLKVHGKDFGQTCKSMFAFDVKKQLWDTVDVENGTSKAKMDREHNLGPRFAHSAVYLPTLRSESQKRSRKNYGYILVHGGYQSMGERMPCPHLHCFDVRNRKWSLRPPQRGMDAPARAYHAAAVTGCCRYLVIHGGSCADLNDTLFMSSELFLFDIDNSEWFLPKVLANSAEPPTARQQHSLVNGIGKHKGLLVLFGGKVSSGGFSNELFILRIVQPAQKDKKVGVVWEKHVVCPPPPSAMELSTMKEDEKKQDRGVRTAGSGGSMIAVPALNRYLFVGGRFSKGLRTSPLLLDASQAEHLDRLGGSPKHEPISKVPPQIAMLDPGPPSVRQRPPASRPANGKTPSQEKIEWKKEKENKSGSLKRPRGKGCTSPQPPPIVAAIPDATPSPPASKENEKPKQAADPDTQKTVDAPVAPSKEMSQGADDESSYMEVKPATEFRTQSHGSNGKKAHGEGEDSDESGVIDLVDDGGDTGGGDAGGGDADGGDADGGDADGGDASLKTPLPNEERDSSDFETPPSKRRKFMTSLEHKKSSKAQQPVKDRTDFDESDNEILLASGGSDFVAASELARRGKSRLTKSGRGRGRGRGRAGASGRGKGQTGKAAEARAAEEKEDTRTKENESAQLVGSLRAENEQLRNEKHALAKDNKELNKQMKSLLAELKVLRAFKKQQSHAPPRRNHLVLNGEPSSSNDDGEDYATPSQTTEFRPRDSDQVSTLRSRLSDLEEECEEVGAERDALSKSLREAEEGKRALETEVHVLKNKIDKQNIEKETLRKQTIDLRSVATEANVAKDNAVKQARKEEEVSAVLRRDLEALRNELETLQSKSDEHNHELSVRQRQNTRLKTELAEVTRKYEQFGSKEKRLTEEVGSHQEKLEELKKLREELVTSKQELQQKNYQLVAELEIVKKEVGIKSAQCDSTKQELERLRSALDREKITSTDIGCEVTRLRRELERQQRTTLKLRDLLKQRDTLVQQVVPQIQRVMSQLGEISCSPDIYEEVEVTSPGKVAEVGTPNGHISPKIRDSGPKADFVANGDGPKQDEAGSPSPQEHVNVDNDNIGQNGREQSPIPESEEIEDVDEP